MKQIINKILIGNLKKIPYFFEQKEHQYTSHNNYALIGKLSTSLLHDILTPLTSLYLTTSITTGAHNEKQITPIIEHSTSQIKEYVTIMKDFLSEHHTESLLHINKEISKCIILLKHQALLHNVQIQYLEFDQIQSKAHPLYIYQIIINLLSNAIEASKESQVKKVIIILKKHKNSYCIECKDFGAGISEKIYSKIGTYHISTKSDSRGFGLYSVYHIVKHVLKGTISIQSEPNNGSLFSCVLPIRE